MLGGLGTGTTTDSSIPVQVQGLVNSTTLGASWITAGASFTCATVVTTDSDMPAGNNLQLRCWGDNTHGQLGNGACGGSSSTPANGQLSLAIVVVWTRKDRRVAIAWTSSRGYNYQTKVQLRAFLSIHCAVLGVACGGNVAHGGLKPGSFAGSGGTESGGGTSVDASTDASDGLELTSLNRAAMLDWFTSGGCAGRFILGVDKSSSSADDLAPYCRLLLNESDLLPVPDGGILGQVCAFAYPGPANDIPLTVDKTSFVYQTGDATPRFYIITSTSATCDPPGWYLEGSGQITLCPITCSTICQDPSALIYGLLGCGGPIVQ